MKPLQNCSLIIRSQSRASPSCKNTFLRESYFPCFTIKLQKGLLINTSMPHAIVVICLASVGSLERLEKAYVTGLQEVG